jgi:hypothetical protein
MSDLVTGIDDLAAEIGTQMAATRDLANGLSVTAEKVRDGVDASLDIDTILLRLTALVTELATGSALANKVAAGINNATDVDGLVTNIGTLATNSIAPVNGRIPVNSNAATATLAAATSWDASFSNAELQRRFYRLMFPGGILSASVTTTASGDYGISGLSVPAGQRVVITRVFLQLLANSPPVTVIVQSVGTVRTAVIPYRLVIDGDAFPETLGPAQYIRLLAGETLGFNLSVAASVFVRLEWYLETVATGLPVIA